MRPLLCVCVCVFADFCVSFRVEESSYVGRIRLVADRLIVCVSV